jgi:DNA-binding transcriptional LysR family regulator
MVNLYQLQIFVAASELGSFSAAAEEFKLTQPGVSQHIRVLEDTYKVKLFNRNGPRIELTEAGRRLLEAARPLIEQAALLEESFSAGLGEVRGRISLIYTKNTTTGLYLLPPLLTAFHRRHSAVRFSLVQTGEEAALEKLQDRETHLALLSRPPRQKSIESLLLHSDELVLVLPPGHPWQATEVDLSSLKGQPFLMRASGSETRRRTEIVLRSASLNLNDLEVVAEIDSVEGIILAAQAGLGIGLASQVVVERFAEAGQVAYARIKLSGEEADPGFDLKREIFLARLAVTPGIERAPSLERLWDYLRYQLQHTNPIEAV